MLSGLASFFFGGGNEPTTTTSSEQQRVNTSFSPSHHHSLCETEDGSSSYTTTETEGGDWLMIVEANRRRRSLASTSEESGDCVLVDPTRDPRVSPVSSAPSSPTPIAYLDGSWYITPPPCFMADSPANMETSPMENLLIEHPSMSVYVGTTSRLSLVGKGGKRRGHRSKAFRRLELVENTADTTESFEEVICCDFPPTEEDVVAPVVDQTPTSLTTQSCRSGLVHCPRQLSAMAAGANELLLQIESRARSQKALREKQTKFFHHRQLERLNKVQEYQSIGKRQHRKDFMKRHSGANNNRKC